MSLPYSFTLQQLAARFNLQAQEVAEILQDIEPVHSDGQTRIFGRDALEAMRAAMASRTIRGVPRPNDTIHD